MKSFLKTLVVVLLALAPTAVALADDGFNPPDGKSPELWQSCVAAILTVLAICVLGFKNAGRTHLD